MQLVKYRDSRKKYREFEIGNCLFYTSYKLDIDESLPEPSKVQKFEY